MSDKHPHIMKLLRQFRSKATIEKKKHFNAESRKTRLSHCLRIPVLILNIVTTSTLFASMTELFKDGWTFVAAALALISALLVGLGEYFKFEKLTAGHRVYGHRFAQIANKADNLILKVQDDLIPAEDMLRLADEVVEEYEQTLSAALEFSTSDDDYQKARKGIEDGQEEYTGKELS